MKKLKILLIMFFIIAVCSISGFFFYQYLLDKGTSEPVNNSDFGQEVNINIKKTETGTVFNKEEVIESSIVSLEIEGEPVSIDILDKNYLKCNLAQLDDNFYLIEFLFSMEPDKEYLTDDEISEDRLYAIDYSKIWYLYNKNTKQFYEIENNYVSSGYSYEISVNLNTTTENGINYLEFDKIYYTSATKNEVNHYKIPIEDLIFKGQLKELNWNDYSIEGLALNKTFEGLEALNTVEITIDLNNDGIEEAVKLEVFEDYINYVNDGFRLSINDKTTDVFTYGIQPTINILDLDSTDNQKEILISPYAYAETLNSFIFTYKDDEIKKVFETHMLELFYDENEVNNIELSVDENKEISFDFQYNNTVQAWMLTATYKLIDGVLVLENNGIYKNKEAQTISTKTTLNLYDEMDYMKPSEKRFEKDREAKLLGTDLKYWVQIEIDGEIKYICLDDNGFIKDLNDFPFNILTNLVLGE